MNKIDLICETLVSFDRFRCYDMLLKNVERHSEVGYADVCGKCLVAVPCSHTNPVAGKLRGLAAERLREA